MDFAAWLRGQIEKQGISLRELGKRSGVSDVLIGYYLAGKRIPKKGTLEKLAKGLGKPIKVVMEAAGYQTEPPQVTQEQLEFLENFSQLPGFVQDAIRQMAKDAAFDPSKSNLKFLGMVAPEKQNSPGTQGTEKMEVSSKIT